MPSSRARGGTNMPRPGDDTILPPIEISPPVGCSRPATQRSVVVLPQPDGPSRTTISPAGTAKLTPSMAGRPTENCLRRSLTSSVAVMSVLPRFRSLAVPVSLVPIRDPGLVQLHIVVKLGQPDLYHLGIEAVRIDRGFLERGEIAELLDHEGLSLLRHAPVQVQSCGIRMGRGLRNSGGIGIDRHTLGRKHHLERRAVL